MMTCNLNVIKASAGSGKTFMLAKKYIQHLLFTTTDGGVTLKACRQQGDMRVFNAHRRLLAITFTNKATDEMKQRIVNELYRLSRPETASDYLDDFMKRSGMSEDEVRWIASQALNELLFDYSNFNVSTIDSFFQGILRNFARELDRDFNYDVQIDEEYAVRVAVHNFLLSLGKEGQPTLVDQWVNEYQRHLLRGESKNKKWKIFDERSDLNDFARTLNTEIFRTSMPDVRNYLGHVDEKGDFHSDFGKIREFKRAVRAVTEHCRGEIEGHLQQLRDALTPFEPVLKYTLKNWYQMGDLLPLTDTLQDADEEKIATQFKNGQEPDGETLAVIHRLVSQHYLDMRLVDLFENIEDNLGKLGVLAMIDVFLEKYRHESNSILIGDTNDLIGVVLASGSDFVYERVGTTIDHFMIDEFQDTSTKQYENFKGLLLESLASGKFNMLIGDAKQSIYRFRNADPTVFREKVDEDFKGQITDGLTPDERPKPGEPTSTNYRSSRKIIEFNNSLFERMGQWFDNPTVALTYQDVKQAFSPNIDEKRVPGYVRVLTGNYRGLLKNDVINEAANLFDDAAAGDKDVNVLSVLPGYLLQLHERYDWGRMGILVNTHAEGHRIVERILDYNQRTKGAHISIESGESLLLNNSPVIRRIIAMLRFIDISQFSTGDDDVDVEEDPAVSKMMERIERNRMRDQRLYVALNDFIQGVSAKPDASPVENGKMLADCLNAMAREGNDESGDETDAFALKLAELLPKAGELTTLVSIIETIIAHFKQGPESAAAVDREAAFLLAFQDTVINFCSQRNGGSVREFLKFWDEKKDKLAVSGSEGKDAINIMTIHTAKGLEFDCVIIPYGNWNLDANFNEKSYWMPREAFSSLMRPLLPVGETLPDEVIPPLVYVKKAPLVGLDKDGLISGPAHDFIAKCQTDLLIDNLNKTYVAMTRPRTELHVFCRPNKEASGSRNGASSAVTLTAILTQFAQEWMHPILDAAAAPTGWYEHGEISTRELIDAKRQGKEPGDEDAPIQVPVESYTVNDKPLDLRVRVEHASSSLVVAGKRYHALLSRIRDRGAVDRVINQGLKHGVITNAPDDLCNLDNVNEHVRRPIMDSATRVATWFDPENKVYSERTITTAGSSLWDEDGIENLRPDRIIRRPDGQLLVIDYKSGQRDDARYCRQVQRYIDKLRAVFPDTPIAGRIWYLLEDAIIDENRKPLSFSI